MRVLVSCDRIGRLGSAEASDVIAEAFAERGAQVAVTPLAEGGDGFAGAVQRFCPGARVLAARSVQQVCELLGESPGYLDATAVAAPSLAELLELPVLPVGAGVTLVVPHREAGRVLTGLTGSLAERGRAQGAELAATLADDSRAARDGSLSRDQLTDETLGRVRALNEIARDRGQSLAQLALAWVLRDPRVTSTLIGVSSLRQLESNLGALENMVFTDDELAAIDQHAVESGVNLWAKQTED